MRLAICVLFVTTTSLESSVFPTTSPTQSPESKDFPPTQDNGPTSSPTFSPSRSPTSSPSNSPTSSPSNSPTSSPSNSPTLTPLLKSKESYHHPSASPSSQCPDHAPFLCGENCCPGTFHQELNPCCGTNQCRCESGSCPFQNRCCPVQAPILCSSSEHSEYCCPTGPEGETEVCCPETGTCASPDGFCCPKHQPVMCGHEMNRFCCGYGEHGSSNVCCDGFCTTRGVCTMAYPGRGLTPPVRPSVVPEPGTNK